MLIVAGGSGTDGVLSQARIEGGGLGIAEFVQQGFRPRLSGENALDRSQGEGAEANGVGQGGTQVVTLIVGEQAQ